MFIKKLKQTNMKTLFTLIAFSFISTIALAGEKYPDLTVSSTGEFKIVIDGKTFDNQKKISLKDLGKGTHYIDIWKKKKGLFGSKYKLVSSKKFEIEKKDLHIDVNSTGYITIGDQKDWDGDYWYKNRNEKDSKKYKDKPDH
jgi:hypothetical protein